MEFVEPWRDESGIDGPCVCVFCVSIGGRRRGGVESVAGILFVETSDHSDLSLRGVGRDLVERIDVDGEDGQSGAWWYEREMARWEDGGSGRGVVVVGSLVGGKGGLEVGLDARRHVPKGKVFTEQFFSGHSVFL